MAEHFTALIYKTGVNACVDVPAAVSGKMKPIKSYIKIKGQINGFGFTSNLVPVRNGPYRLFVNLKMLKGGHAVVGRTANFSIEQDMEQVEVNYPISEYLREQLTAHDLLNDFNALAVGRRKNILKYLAGIKTEATAQKNIAKLIAQLTNKEKNVRIPWTDYK
jgi:hypothetical protein